ncbi:MAG: hypothetical protein H0V50_02200 [Thermoleophilaceae bacterium]|nr:hypothetical protein [Thermoleophilaceae bacterium]
MLVIVVAVVGIAAVLLAKTVQNAQSINKKAQNIATTGTGINTATDSVTQLTRTNQLATSILGSAEPLEGQLDGIVSTAKRINGLAGSINGTAGSINSSATTINGTATDINSSATDINSAAGSINNSAGSINSSAGAINSRATSINSSAGTINTSANRIDRSAGSINRTATLVDRDVSLINRNLDVTLNLASGIKSDTGNILGQAVFAHDTAGCIDKKLNGVSGNDGDCKGTTSTSKGGGLSLLPEGSRSADGFRKLLRDKAALENQRPGGPVLKLPSKDPDAGVLDPVLKNPGAPQQQGGGNSTPPPPAVRGVIEGLFPGFRGQAGLGK